MEVVVLGVFLHADVMVGLCTAYIFNQLNWLRKLSILICDKKQHLRCDVVDCVGCWLVKYTQWCE